MDRGSCSADVPTTKDNQVSSLPQLRVQKPHQRCRPTQSPGSSPRLPPIHAGKEIVMKEERNRGAYSQRSGSYQVSREVKCAECSWSSYLEPSLEKRTPVNTRWLPVKLKSQQKMVSNTSFTPENPKQASYKDPDEEVTSNTTYFSKPRFGRRSVAQRSNLYRTRSTDEILDSEILAMEENSPHVFAAPDVPSKLKDLNGKKLDSSSVYKEDITCMLPSFEGKGEESEATARPARTHNTRARKRFLDALDQHYYNNFVAANPGRRMAICEEIENTIVVGNITLAWYREHLRLQAVLDGWFL